MPQSMQAGPAVRQHDMPLGDIVMAVRNVQRAVAEDGAPASDAPLTFELVFTTGAPVRRYDWLEGRYFLEELVVEDGAINLARLERGAPLLNTHWSWSLEDQIGVVRNPEIADGRGTVQVQMSRRESVRGIVQDLQDGVINNSSVGYTRDAIEMIAPSEENGMWIYRVTRWTPLEVSMVPIPADMDSQVVRSADGHLRTQQGHELRTYPCQITHRAAAPAAASPNTPAAGATAETRNQPTGATMPQANQPGAGTPAAIDTSTIRSVEQPQTGAAPAAPDTEAIRAQAVQAERQRASDIRSAAQAARGTLGADADTLAQRLIDEGVSADEARRQMLDALAERSAAQNVRGQAAIQTTRDETETARRRMGDALLQRAAPHLADRLSIDQEGARNFRGMDLVDMARSAIRAAGGNPDGLSRREIALAALNCDADARRAAGMHSTSDLPVILGNAINRSLAAAYELAPRTFTAWARQSTNKDFRAKAVAQLSALGQLEKVVEGGEYKYLRLADSSESYSLSKYGGIIAVTWEAIVNDDLNAFSRLPLMLANKAATLEGDLVYAALLGTTLMSDGKALFDNAHGNVAASGTALTDVSLSAARAAMRKQTAPDGSVLNLTPSILVVGPNNELAANKYTSTAFVAAKAVDINPAFNTSLTVVVDARITGNAWYLIASPAMVDTVEYAYLEGEQGLFTERREGFEVDGVEIKARHVFGAKAIDWRGMYKNAGA